MVVGLGYIFWRCYCSKKTWSFASSRVSNQCLEVDVSLLPVLRTLETVFFRMGWLIWKRGSMECCGAPQAPNAHLALLLKCSLDFQHWEHKLINASLGLWSLSVTMDINVNLNSVISFIWNCLIVCQYCFSCCLLKSWAIFFLFLENLFFSPLFFNASRAYEVSNREQSSIVLVVLSLQRERCKR